MKIEQGPLFLRPLGLPIKIFPLVRGWVCPCDKHAPCGVTKFGVAKKRIPIRSCEFRGSACLVAVL